MEDEFAIQYPGRKMVVGNLLRD